jgi:hypothetical protein
MAEGEVRFKRIAATAWRTGRATSPDVLRLFGLTEDGILYEWSDRKREWLRFPMNKEK